MDQWKKEYYPEEDERDSPYEFLVKNGTKKEIAVLNDKIDRISRVSQAHWQEVVTIKPIPVKPKLPDQELYQLTSGDFRVYLTPDKARKVIVIVFICRKDAQKARTFNLDRARLNMKRYYAEVSGGKR